MTTRPRSPSPSRSSAPFQSGLRSMQTTHRTTLMLRAKVVVVGDACVGKTAIVQMLKSGGHDYPKSYIMTIGVDFGVKQIKVPDTDCVVELFLFDCPGQGVFNKLEQGAAYYDNAAFVCVVFDVSNRDSFESCGRWIQGVRAALPDANAPLPGVLIANKVDLREGGVNSRAVVDAQEGYRFAQQNGLDYFETSAASATGIDAPFHHMASSFRQTVPPRQPALKRSTTGDVMEESSGSNSDDGPAGEGCFPDSASSTSGVSSSRRTKGPPPSSPAVKTTRTRTVKSRAIFTPEDNTEKKPRGRGGKPGKRRYRRRGLKELLGDEEVHQPTEASGDGGAGTGDALRKRSRNESDGENRWDRIRAKVKLLLLKIRRDTHYLQVYAQDGWKSSGREKLKPTVELGKATERVKKVKAELRDLTKRLTEMNSGGARWGALQEDPEGLIEVAKIMCTKCNRGDSDDNDDILLCDYAGCFRAYHQNCLSPPIKPEAFPGEEEDWFCWQCECLADCLEMLEEEFHGSKFASWEDVFPEAKEGADSGAGTQGNVLSDDSDDSDDESFKGSSSEEEKGEEGDGGLKPDDEEEENGRDEGGDEEEENGRNEGGDEDTSSSTDSGVDDDTRWMSDAESVGSDEVAKLRSEAGEAAASDNEGDPGFGGGSSMAVGSRGSRARERRDKRNKALGLSDDVLVDSSQEQRAIAAAIAGNGKIDTANIFARRTRGKRSVDYIKLNEVVFGNESVDGDQLSSDAQDENLSEAYASESDGSSLSFTSRPQKAHRKLPSIDPLTGQKRKRGRPRKVLGAAGSSGSSVDPETGEKRKRGRPKKIKSDGGRDAETPAAKRKVGRPAAKGKAEKPAAKRKRGRPKKVECHDGAIAGGSVDNSGVKRKRGRPKKVVTVSENGSVSSTEKRKRGRPRKDGSPRTACHAGPEDGEASSKKRRGSGRPPKQVGEGQDGIVAESASAALERKAEPTQERHGAGGAVSETASVAEPPVAAVGSSASPSAPFAGLKRGRGRPRKNSITSPAAVVDAIGDDPSAVEKEQTVPGTA